MQVTNSLMHKVENRANYFVVHPESDLAELKESLFQFIKYLCQLEDAKKAQEELEKSKEEQKAVEPEQPKQE